eukprot:jgi/Psemu1/31754/gm1.31754_g
MSGCGLGCQSPTGEALNDWLCFIGLRNEPKTGTPSTAGLYDDDDDDDDGIVENHDNNSSYSHGLESSRKTLNYSYAETGARSSGRCVDCARQFRHCTCGDNDADANNGKNANNANRLPATCDTPECSQRVCSDCMRCQHHCTCVARFSSSSHGRGPCRSHSIRDGYSDSDDESEDSDEVSSESDPSPATTTPVRRAAGTAAALAIGKSGSNSNSQFVLGSRDGIVVGNRDPSGIQGSSTSTSTAGRSSDLIKSFQSSITFASASTAKVSNSLSHIPTKNRSSGSGNETKPNTMPSRLKRSPRLSKTTRSSKSNSNSDIQSRLGDF